MSQPDLIELRPLSPFVGSYPCSLADADVITDQFVEDEATGQIVKRRVARKHFKGVIEVVRAATHDELLAIKNDTLPASIAVHGDIAKLKQVIAAALAEQRPTPVVTVSIMPTERTVRVPANIAADLVKRGLAEYAAPVPRAA